MHGIYETKTFSSDFGDLLVLRVVHESIHGVFNPPERIHQSAARFR